MIVKIEEKDRSNNCGFKKCLDRQKIYSSRRKKEDRGKTKRTIPFGALSWRAEKVHKRGQTTRTIPICQPLFAEINSRDVRWMQLPWRIGARMHFFAPSRVKRDRENFAPPSESYLVCETSPLDRKMTVEHVKMRFIHPRRESDTQFLKWNDVMSHSVCIASRNARASFIFHVHYTGRN